MSQEIAAGHEHAPVAMLPAVGLIAGTLIGFSRGLMVFIGTLLSDAAPIFHIGALEVSGLGAALLVGPFMIGVFGGFGFLLGVLARRVLR
jgi:hypothetical protein